MPAPTLRISFLLLAALCGGSLPLAPTAAAAEPAAELRDIGGLVLPIAQNDPRLDVSLHLADQPVTDQTMQTLVSLQQSQPEGERIAWLNLAGSEITDAGCDALAQLTSLERLHLERTAVTDAGLAKLDSLKSLTYLNLYGTKVTDAGLATLAALPNLKRAYVWQTGVTEEAIAAFGEQNPNTSLVGEVKLVPAEFPKEEKPEEKETGKSEGEEAKKAEEKRTEPKTTEPATKAEDKPKGEDAADDKSSDKTKAD